MPELQLDSFIKSWETLLGFCSLWKLTLKGYEIAVHTNRNPEVKVSSARQIRMIQLKLKGWSCQGFC